MTTSRGERNNNPLNIRHTGDQWQGARIEQTDKEFVQFQSMEYGYRAAWKILQSYFDRFRRKGIPFTVRTIIYRWAPPEDGNATEAYIRKVIQLSGIGGKENLLPPNNVKSYLRLSRLLATMTCVECGLPLNRVSYEAIYKGYRMAFPQNTQALDEWMKAEDEYRDW